MCSERGSLVFWQGRFFAGHRSSSSLKGWLAGPESHCSPRPRGPPPAFCRARALAWWRPQSASRPTAGSTEVGYDITTTGLRSGHCPLIAVGDSHRGACSPAAVPCRAALLAFFWSRALILRLTCALFHRHLLFSRLVGAKILENSNSVTSHHTESPSTKECES